MKIIKKYYQRILLILLIIFAIIGIFTVGIIFYNLIFPQQTLQEQVFNLTFYINETQEPIDGDVYLNDIFIGTTKNGVLQVNASILSSGKLKFNGSYNGVPFEFYYEFYKDKAEKGETVFIVYSQSLKELAFDASKLNLAIIEKQIFDMVNLEREKYLKAEIRKLRWNDKIANIARQHSQDMSNNTVKSIKERLKKSRIFYLGVGENIAKFQVNSSTDIAKETINIWLEDPLTKSNLLDIDNIYSDAGVGIACSKNTCYVTMIFISSRGIIKNEMKKNYCWFIPLYDKALPFDFTVDINIKLNATEKMNMYIAEEDSYEECIQRRSINFIKEYKDITVLDEKVTIKKGDGILIETTSDTNFTIVVDYLI